MHLVIGHHRADGQAELAVMYGFRDWVTSIVPHTVAGLLVRGYGVVDLGLDALLGQVLLQRIAEGGLVASVSGG